MRSEGDWEEADGNTAAAVNRDRRFSCVSSSISPSSTLIVASVPTYLSVDNISQMSDIPPRALVWWRHEERLREKRKLHPCANNK